VMDDQGLLNINHTGGWASFATVISNYPGQKISIILLSNNGSFNSYGKANNVARALFGDKFKTGAPTAKSEDWGSKPTVKVDESVLKKYTNTYKLGDGWYVTFTLEDGKLMVQASGEPKFSTEPKADSVIWVPGYSSEFVFRNVTDKADVAKYRGIMAPRITPIKADASQLGEYAGNYYSTELEATYRVYVDKGKLMVHHMRLGDFELVPDIATPGVFNGDTGHMQFEKDARGKVTGFKLSGGRIRNIRFDKQ
jgi:hypothetical protein